MTELEERAAARSSQLQHAVAARSKANRGRYGEFRWVKTRRKNRCSGRRAVATGGRRPPSAAARFSLGFTNSRRLPAVRLRAAQPRDFRRSRSCARAQSSHVGLVAAPPRVLTFNTWSASAARGGRTAGSADHRACLYEEGAERRTRSNTYSCASDSRSGSFNLASESGRGTARRRAAAGAPAARRLVRGRTGLGACSSRSSFLLSELPCTGRAAALAQLLVAVLALVAKRVEFYTLAPLRLRAR